MKRIQTPTSVIYDSMVGVVGEEWPREIGGRFPLNDGLRKPLSVFADAGLLSASMCSVEGEDSVGDMRLRIEFDVDLLRDIYGLGGGFGLEPSLAVGVVGVELFEGQTGDLSPLPDGMLGSGIPLTISIPNSSVRGRGGGRSTIASRS